MVVLNNGILKEQMYICNLVFMTYLNEEMVAHILEVVKECKLKKLGYTFSYKGVIQKKNDYNWLV